MKTEINEISINGETYIRRSDLEANNPAMNKEGMPFCLVRTYSAGVFAGYIKRREGKEVELVDSIRLWAWYGAASLSQLAIEGVKKPNECKFGMPINHTVTEAIEIIQCTDTAKKIIEGVTPWKTKN